MEEAQAGATSRQSYRDHADDLVILCKKGKADEALQQLRKIMSKLKLTVNEEKARICKVPEGEFDFLGYTFGRLCRRQSQLVGHARQVRQQGRCPHLTHYLATIYFSKCRLRRGRLLCLFTLEIKIGARSPTPSS
jgi:hypothetical protein